MTPARLSANYLDATTWHGFLYSAGSFTSIDVPGRYRRTFVEGINDAGQIVGFSIEAVPEPGSMLLFGSGLMGVWATALRKRRSG
jgi:PEP-CTERM motif